jgi:hypothetical protein
MYCEIKASAKKHFKALPPDWNVPVNLEVASNLFELLKPLARLLDTHLEAGNAKI